MRQARIARSVMIGRPAVMIGRPAVTIARATIARPAAKVTGRPAIAPSAELRRPT